jgi:hypothetical protein
MVPLDVVLHVAQVRLLQRCTAITVPALLCVTAAMSLLCAWLWLLQPQHVAQICLLQGITAQGKPLVVRHSHRLQQQQQGSRRTQAASQPVSKLDRWVECLLHSTLFEEAPSQVQQQQQQGRQQQSSRLSLHRSAHDAQQRTKKKEKNEDMIKQQWRKQTAASSATVKPAAAGALGKQASTDATAATNGTSTAEQTHARGLAQSTHERMEAS